MTTFNQIYISRKARLSSHNTHLKLWWIKYFSYFTILVLIIDRTCIYVILIPWVLPQVDYHRKPFLYVAKHSWNFKFFLAASFISFTSSPYRVFHILKGKQNEYANAYIENCGNSTFEMEMCLMDRFTRSLVNGWLVGRLKALLVDWAVRTATYLN